MATRIRASCPLCGVVELRPADLRLFLSGTLAEPGDATTYRFTCPSCGSMVDRPADSRIARLLHSGGVPIVPAVDDPGPAAVAWVGRLACGHDVGGRADVRTVPEPGEHMPCPQCLPRHRTRELIDVVVSDHRPSVTQEIT